jgi:hypothetical protein
MRGFGISHARPARRQKRRKQRVSSQCGLLLFGGIFRATLGCGLLKKRDPLDLGLDFHVLGRHALPQSSPIICHELCLLGMNLVLRIAAPERQDVRDRRVQNARHRLDAVERDVRRDHKVGPLQKRVVPQSLLQTRLARLRVQ